MVTDGWFYFYLKFLGMILSQMQVERQSRCDWKRAIFSVFRLSLIASCSVSSAVDDVVAVVSMTVAKVESLADDSASGVSMLRALAPFAPCLPVIVYI